MCVFSHEIREEWSVFYNSDTNAFSGKVVFYENEGSIGESNISLTGNLASIHTCGFKCTKYLRQKLSQEFAARTFKRAYEISKLLGMGELWANSYFSMTYTEMLRDDSMPDSESVIYGEPAKEMNAIFEHLGLKSAHLLREELPQAVVEQLSKSRKAYNGNRFNDHLMRLEDCVLLATANWKKWFYEERIKAVYGKAAWKNLDNKIDWEEVEKQRKINDLEAQADVLTKLQAKMSPDSPIYKKIADSIENVRLELNKNSQDLRSRRSPNAIFLEIPQKSLRNQAKNNSQLVFFA